MKECLYYEQIDKGVKCNLCPHNCVIREGKTGICNVRINKENKLYTLNYGVISSISIDSIEKKPLFHFYPGSSIASIGTYGCNFRCDFCQNYNISMVENFKHIMTEDFKKNHNYVSPEAIIEKFKKIENNIGVAFTYNEPTIWFEYVLETAKLAKKNGLKTVLVTNGFINEAPFRELLEYIDAINMDLKAFNNEFYKKICGGSLEEVKNNIKIVHEKSHIEISTLLIDDLNTNREEIEELASFISEIDEKIPLHFNRFHPAYKMNNEPTKVQSLIYAKRIASKYLKYIYIGNVFGFESNTECPRCKTVLIERDLGVGKIVNIKNGKCSNCGRKADIMFNGV